jgi:uncharacterized protein (TIGR02118 family)
VSDTAAHHYHARHDNEGDDPMIRVSVMYPKGEGATFDFDYYKATHMAIVERNMPGVLRTEADKAVDGPYLCVGHLYFESMETLGTAMAAPGMGEVMGDIPNFTNAAPAMQIAEIF